MSSWSDSEVDYKKWLPVHGDTDSILSLIKYMGLELLNATDNLKILEMIEKEKILGFICSMKEGPIEFKSSKTLSDISYLPTNVQNGYPTIGLLNMTIAHFKSKGLGEILSEHSGDLDVENRLNFFRPQVITPIAFAHNFTAKTVSTTEDSSYISCFIHEKSMNYLIGRTGEKIQTEFTTKSPSEFINEIKKLKGNVVIVIKDPLRELTEDLRRQVDVIGRLTKETETDQNSSYMDDSMTYEDLMELQMLSREFEDAENFELSLSNGSKTRKRREEQDSEALKEKKEAEKKVIELKKSLGEFKEILTQTYSEVYDIKTLYTSVPYLEFLQFYKRNVHVKTPMILKHSSLGKSPLPIKTPKSVKRNRLGSTFSTSSVGSSVVNTPRSSKSTKFAKSSNTNKLETSATPKRSTSRTIHNNTAKGRANDKENTGTPSTGRRGKRARETKESSEKDLDGEYKTSSRTMKKNDGNVTPVKKRLRSSRV